jgi:hypothetical protein
LISKDNSGFNIGCLVLLIVGWRVMTFLVLLVLLKLTHFSPEELESQGPQIHTLRIVMVMAKSMAAQMYGWWLPAM